MGDTWREGRKSSLKLQPGKVGERARASQGKRNRLRKKGGKNSDGEEKLKGGNLLLGLLDESEWRKKGNREKARKLGGH